MNPIASPARGSDPRDPALPARARARERAQDPARRERASPASGLHRGTRAAEEPRRPAPTTRTRTAWSASTSSRADAASPRSRRSRRTATLHADHPVPCKIAAKDEAAEALDRRRTSTTSPCTRPTRWSRSPGFVQSGATVAAIAARFGVTERLVEQRLRLGNAAPELLDAYPRRDHRPRHAQGVRGHHRPRPPARGVRAGDAPGPPGRRRGRSSAC